MSTCLVCLRSLVPRQKRALAPADPEMNHKSGADTADINGKSRQAPSIFALISTRKWNEALEHIDALPSSSFAQHEQNHRTPLHVLCQLKFTRGDSDDEASTEDVGVDTCLSNEALAVAQALIDASHDRAPPTFAFHPVGEEDDSYGSSLHGSVLTVEDVCGNTPLHCLCSNRRGASQELVRLILENTADYGQHLDGGMTLRWRADGEELPTVFDLLTKQNYHGCTAVHNCADGGCAEDIRDLILDACYHYGNKDHHKPSNNNLKPVLFEGHNKQCTSVDRKHPMLIRDKDGEVPLHFACDAGIEAQVLKRFVLMKEMEISTAAVQMISQNGRLPIDELITWCIDEYELESNQPFLEERLPNDVEVALWSRIEVLLAVASANYPLHAAATLLHFPALVLRIACKRFGGENGAGFLKRDELGRTPLHRAACSTMGPGSLVSAYGLGSGEYLDLCKWEEEPQSPIEYLVHQCADALRIPCNDGKLPLHLAAANAQTKFEDIEVMLDAAPDTLATREIKTGLIPFMSAAMNSCATSESVDMSFRLILKNPALVRGQHRCIP